MGHWTMVSATPSITNRDDVYGHYFAITFRLKYSASMMGSFAESPILEWKETITMIERTKGSYWEAAFDQFGRNPNSPTFGMWVYRYSLAHTAVLAGNYANNAPSRLYDKNGAQLPKTTFTKNVTTKQAADEVRNYLKKNGGVLVVTVTDSPGINKPDDATTDKFRILTFDCGLKGMSPRINAIQHLRVAGNVEANWTRECELGLVSQPYNVAGLRKDEAPDDVRVYKPFTGGPQDGTYM